MTEAARLAARLRRVLGYDPATGIFRWMVATSSRALVGSVAGGFVNKAGYRRICIDGVKYYEHRLAWLYMTGDWPSTLIDHRNGIRNDNRWSNLREASTVQNAVNKRKYPSKHLLKGAYFKPQQGSQGKWQAAISQNGRQVYIGSYSSAEEAHAAYIERAKEIYGEFARQK